MRSEVEEIYQLHAEICQALADPKRLLILNALRDGRRSVGELVVALDLRQANVSQHLGVLRQRSMVVAEREGAQVYYHLAHPKIIQALDILREVLAEQLARKAELHDAYREAL